MPILDAVRPITLQEIKDDSVSLGRAGKMESVKMESTIPIEGPGAGEPDEPAP